MLIAWMSKKVERYSIEGWYGREADSGVAAGQEHEA
jgi:hypothetical protein